MIEQHYLDAQAVTSSANGKHHFFGYYDKHAWDATGRYLLALEVDFMDRQPTPDDAATIGLIDTQGGNRWTPLDETRAWCWQQSCMLQWLPTDPANKIIYNQRDGDRFISVICDVHSGETRTLPRPIYCVSRDGKQALSINFARLNRTRPGYGYFGVDDPGENDPHPADDGIFWMDVETGETKLILSYQQMRDFHPQDSMAAGQHWFNHLLFSTDDSRFVFLHRWQYPEQTVRPWVDRFVSAKPDGSEPCLVADDGYFSHFDYFSGNQVLGWSHQNDLGTHYILYTTCSDEKSILGEEVFSVDGHCSFSPDREWMLTDTYPDEEHIRTLILYHMESGARIDVGRFYAPPELQGPIRCDLHPRWSRDGLKVYLDSAHEGTRQTYVMDVSPVIRSRQAQAMPLRKDQAR